MKYIKLLYRLLCLRHNTKKTKEEIQYLQRKKLYQMLHYAYDHSPYYQAMFQQAGITKENLDRTAISKFPSINKNLLMENFDELITVNDVLQQELFEFDKEEHQQKVFKNEYHVVHSSGSTGKPGYFIYDEDAWEQMLLAILRGALWDMSIKAILTLLWKKPRIAYIAATDGRYGGAMAVTSGIEGVHAKQLSLDIKQPLAQWIDEITTFQPNIIIGYASAIKILAELVDAGKVSVKVERIISCGEPLNANLRAYLKQAFQCEIVNFYGASESLALGVEVSQQEGMYLFDDMNVIEMVDGKMYLTSLYNFAQPLIRYELSDCLAKQDDVARYPFTRIKNIVGRNEDLMWFEEESGKRDFLHPLAIEGFCIEGMLDYQFIQIDDSSFELDIEVSNSSMKNEIHKQMSLALKQMLREKQLDYVQFIIMFVDEIVPEKATGKKQLIRQKKGSMG